MRKETRLEVLPGIGHFPQVEAPMEVVDLIEDFMSTTAKQPVPSEESKA
jgi:pimeloyl-ACP methyl ester carboxylesterase